VVLKKKDDLNLEGLLDPLVRMFVGRAAANQQCNFKREF